MWLTARVGYVETVRALSRAAGVRGAAVRAFRREWPAFSVVELDPAVAERAASLTETADLQSLDAIHLASALVLPAGDVTLATWDRRLHAAAAGEGLRVLPERAP